MRDFNPIIGVHPIRKAFTDWVIDHHAHFGVFPGSFIYVTTWGEDIEYSEKQIWDAIENLPELKPLLEQQTNRKTPCQN